VSEPTLATIVGFPHSGSTLLGDVLASAPGVLHLGEVAMLFRRYVKNEATVCSCGEPLSACELWGQPVKAAVAATPNSPPEIAAELESFVRSRRAPPPQLREVFGTLLREVAADGRATYLVDSSNWPAFGRLLREAFPGDTHAIHLLRDPRATVYSRVRRGVSKGKRRSQGPRLAASVVRDSLRWSGWNRDARGMADVVQLRYEDLCRAPGEELDRLTDAIGWPRVTVGPGQVVERRREHVIWGNKGAHSGPVTLQLDDRWREAAPAWARGVAWTLTRQERRRYGYVGGAR